MASLLKKFFSKDTPAKEKKKPEIVSAKTISAAKPKLSGEPVKPISYEVVSSEAPYQPSADGLVDIFAPCDGVVVNQKDIPDPTFAEGHMGYGVGIEPTNGKFKVFMNGDLVVLYKTKHAYFIKNSVSGVTTMIHIGIDTVEIPEGKGVFKTNRQVNDAVIAGEDLCEVKLETIKAEGKSIVTPVLVQLEGLEGRTVVVRKNSGEVVKAGDLILSVREPKK